jgi:hypothetical protein
MNLTLPPFPLIDDDLSQPTDDLSQLLPRVFIPHLQGNPQDPIMDTLRIKLESGLRASQPEQCARMFSGFPEEEGILFWEHAVKREVRVQVSSIR